MHMQQGSLFLHDKIMIYSVKYFFGYGNKPLEMFF